MNMGKSKSKYENLVSQIITVEYKDTLYDVKVTDTQMIEKVSKKTGRKYKVRRIFVKLVNANEVLEIGTQSWNKKSFMRNLLKGETVKKFTQAQIDEINRDTRILKDEKLYGTMSDLQHWGEMNGKWKKLTDEYSFLVYIRKINDIYNKSAELQSDWKPRQKFNRIIDEVEEAINDLTKLKVAEHKGELEINEENLRKLARGLEMKKYGEMIKDEVKDRMGMLSERIRRNQGGNYYSDEIDWNNLTKMIQAQSVSKYGFGDCKSEREVKQLYRKLSKQLHPDTGGDEANFIEMKKEYDRALHKYA